MTTPLTVMITGATSGIGKATAYKLAAHKHNLIITGRRKQMLMEISTQLTTKYGIKVLAIPFDISKREQFDAAFKTIGTHFNTIDVLINNAGLALELSSIDEGDINDWDIMLDTNVKGLLYATKYALPYLKRSHNPLIINIGSIAGKETYPNGNIYCASKHAVESLSKAMRIDLLQHGIKVTQICPGALESEFSEVRFKGDSEKAKNVYKGFKPLMPEDIAHIIDFIIMLPPHINVNDILVMPKQQASAGIILKNDC